jgi:hypothetical protein
MASATAVVYSDNGTPYYAGQGLVQMSCANGVCHSSTATHDSRRGAPHGLDFDLQPLFQGATPDNVAVLKRGVDKVREEADDIYGQLMSGAMPPGAAGQRPTPTWTYADGTAASDLPAISTDVGKATVRAWLACGAPVIAGTTGAPADAATIGAVLPPRTNMMPVGNTFESVYNNVLKSCGQSCHAPPPTGLDPLDLSSQSVAYNALVNKDGAGACAGKGKLVVPGSCKTSLLWIKLQPNPVCGAQMPLGMAPVSQAALDAVCAWIDAGAKQ